MADRWVGRWIHGEVFQSFFFGLEPSCSVSSIFVSFFFLCRRVSRRLISLSPLPREGLSCVLLVYFSFVVVPPGGFSSYQKQGTRLSSFSSSSLLLLTHVGLQPDRTRVCVCLSSHVRRRLRLSLPLAPVSFASTKCLSVGRFAPRPTGRLFRHGTHRSERRRN